MNLILPAAQLLDELRELSPRSIDEPSDSRYLCPETDWLRNEFGPYCAAEHPPYEPQKRDCDKIVLWTLAAACDALCKNTSVADCGYALFRCDVLLSPEGLNGIVPAAGVRSHATILARTVQAWCFFEPQNGRCEMARGWLDGFDALDFVLIRVRL